jgi:hypothetical protein
LALASFRITRFIVIDDLLSVQREAFMSWFLNKGGPAWDKLYDLFGCTWCVGVYVSAAVYWLYIQDFELSWEAFLNISAIAGAQGMLHALEPSEE